MRPMEQAWQTARRHLLPDTATPQEVQDVRRVFFMGAYSLYQLHQAAEQVSAADSAMFHDVIERELRMFAATVGTELEAKV